MIINAENVLLFIHPTQPASSEPVDDDLTAAVEAALRSPLTTGCVFSNGRFAKDTRFLGIHTCTAPGCTARSHSCDYEIAPGVYTNFLAHHYLRYHRV